MSFAFLIFSSSPVESVIIKPPYTIDPIAKIYKNIDILVIQFWSVFENQLFSNSRLSPVCTTEASPRHSLRFAATLDHVEYIQSAKIWAVIVRYPIKNIPRSIIIFFIILKSWSSRKSCYYTYNSPCSRNDKNTNNRIYKWLYSLAKFFWISSGCHESNPNKKKHPNSNDKQKCRKRLCDKF